MRKNPRRILSPQRLPFRHPGIGRTTKLTCTAGALKLNLNSVIEERYLPAEDRALRVGMTGLGRCALKSNARLRKSDCSVVI